jgi:hypothetical protein
MTLCPNCGAEQPSDAKFCEECGSPFQAAPSKATYAGSSLSVGVTHPPTVPASLQGAEGSDLLFCTRCGTQLEADSIFCHNCGAAAGGGVRTEAPAEVPVARTHWGPPPTLRVVVGQHQVILPFPEGKTELIWGRKDLVAHVNPDFDLTPYNGAALGVSRQHARLFYEHGQLYIEDKGSTNHTQVQGRQLTPSTSQPLRSGDEIRLGRLVLIVFVERQS